MTVPASRRASSYNEYTWGSGGLPVYHVLVIGNVAQRIAAIPGLKGQTMAYGDLASTSRHPIPKPMPAGQGLKAGQNCQEQFVGARDAVALAVRNGNAAGGVSMPICETMVQRGKIDPARVRVSTGSKPYPNYPRTTRGGLDPNLKPGAPPQALPRLAGLSIYQWKHSFRASTVPGLVGAGGIGFQLMATSPVLEYRQVAAIMVAILATVTAVDGLSGWPRRKFI